MECESTFGEFGLDDGLDDGLGDQNDREHDCGVGGAPAPRANSTALTVAMISGMTSPEIDESATKTIKPAATMPANDQPRLPTVAAPHRGCELARHVQPQIMSALPFGNRNCPSAVEDFRAWPVEANSIVPPLHDVEVIPAIPWGRGKANRD